MGCNQFEGNLTSSQDLSTSNASQASYNEVLVPVSGTESLRRVVDLELQAGTLYVNEIPSPGKGVPVVPQQLPTPLNLTGSVEFNISASLSFFSQATVHAMHRDLEASFNYSFQQQARLIDLAQCYFFVPLS